MILAWPDWRASLRRCRGLLLGHAVAEAPAREMATGLFPFARQGRRVSNKFSMQWRVGHILFLFGRKLPGIAK